MQIKDFKSIVRTFSDPDSEFLVDGSRILMSVNDELIEAGISLRSSEVFVDEGNGPVPANSWIIKRLAKLPLLANRLKETIAQTPHFVSPSASLLSSLEVKPNEEVLKSDDGLAVALEALSSQSPLETTVVYVTSDAGEGKTSLINELARRQAERFINNDADWLLVPIPLGGRHFLRFDDITVGALQNKYRFSFLYYDSFLALVRMGVIIPAFDGFEEMFVEGSSGEALSAMGILVGNLDSMGSMVIAARKAYFEFENLKTQERLYDTISDYSVGFGKLEIERWGKSQFIQYCVKRSVSDPELIYERVAERLGVNHSLLTRPVLVRRLVDIAVATQTLDDFLEAIHSSGSDFFSVFVRGIIEREAKEKWVDRSGEVGLPLLTVDEHCELLSQVALAMWDARVDYLKQDLLEFVADYFSESKRKTAFQAQQIRERIRGHALLVASSNAAKSVEFDHEEFRLFFLGEGIADQLRPLSEKARGEVMSTMRKGPLPKHSERAFMQAIKRDLRISRLEAAKFLLSISALEGQASFTQQNCNSLIARLLKGVDGQGLELVNLAFGADALRDRMLSNLKFDRCYFSPTSLENSQVCNCVFENCNFSQLRLYNSSCLKNVSFVGVTSIDSIQLPERGVEIWDPALIHQEMKRIGVSFESETTTENSVDSIETLLPDQESRDFERILRYFMRSTHISESVISIKLGNSASRFIDIQIPELLEIAYLVKLKIEVLVFNAALDSVGRLKSQTERFQSPKAPSRGLRICSNLEDMTRSDAGRARLTRLSPCIVVLRGSVPRHSHRALTFCALAK